MFKKLGKWWNAPDNSNDSMLDPVPWKLRRTAWSLIFVSFGWGFTVTPLFIGSILAAGANSSDMIASICIGDLMLFALSILICIPAYRTGCNNPLLFRFVFGRHGWKVPCSVIVICGLGWQGGLTGWFAEVVVGVGSEYFTPVAVMGGILVIISIYFGIKGIEVVGNAAVIFLSGAAALCFYLCINEAGGLNGLIALADGDKGVETVSREQMTNMVVGSLAVGASVSADFTRFCKKGWVVFMFVAINFFFVQPVLQILGIAGVLVFDSHLFSAYASIVNSAFYIFCLISLIFAVWTTCNSNAYFTQVSFSNVTKKNLRVSAVVVGGVGLVSAAFGFSNYVGTFIDFLATVIPPLVGIVTVDYYFIHKMKYDIKLRGRIPNWNPAAVIAYVIAVMVAFLYTPPFLATAVWGPLMSSVLYAITYAIFTKAGIKCGYSVVSQEQTGPWNPMERAIAEGQLTAKEKGA